MLPNANHPAPSARRLGSFQGTNSASASDDDDDALARHTPTPTPPRRLEDDAVVRAMRDVKELFAVGTIFTPDDDDDVTPPRRVVEEEDAVVRACVIVVVFIIVVAIIIPTSFPDVVRVSTACVVASLCYDECVGRSHEGGRIPNRKKATFNRS